MIAGTLPGRRDVLRRPILRGLLLRVFVPCLVPLAACGTVEPPATPAFSPSVRSPAEAPATTRPGASSNPAPLESPSSGASRPAAPVVATVVLDPGHNGANTSHPEMIDKPVPTGRGGTKPCNTTGTSTDAGYSEAAFNWDVTLRIRDALTARGVRVVLTRPDNSGVGPCVNDRAAIANRAGADAMVSIHADGAAPSGHGFHVAYADPSLAPSQGQPSTGLAEALVRAMRAGGFPAAGYIGSGGLDARSDLAGLNLARVPAVLVECANMRNPAEAALISSPEGRSRYAAAITDGIVAWLASRGAQPPNGGRRH
ncbi:MAG: N-acetylmuramoyl-L-alanine amidase [Pseudonocardiaceae bacterium]